MGTIHYLNFPFEKKNKSNGSIYIEGYSNFNVPDRGFERVDPKGGRFENYKKNPIILFDHGKDPAFGSMPVGKAISIEARDSGLFTKAYISNSKTEKISAIRDLVEEGILKTFSIGFDPAKDEKDKDGVRVITDFELIEQSIVPIPMNQDSTFSVMQKRFQKSNNMFGQMFCNERRLLAKGAVDAAAITTMMWKSGKKPIDLLVLAAKIAHTPKDVIQATLTGDLIPMPPHVKRALLKALGEPTMDEEEKPKEEMPKENILKDETPKEDEEKPIEKADVSAPMMLLLSVEVPKSVFEDAELATAFIEEHGYKPGMMTESEDSFVFQQAEGEDLDLSGASKVELGDGIMGLIAPTKGAKACDDKPKQKAMGTPTIPIPSGSDAVPQDDNPHLNLARQTNVLLGALIQEIQKLSQKFDGMPAPKEEPEEPEDEMEDDSLTKSLDLISKYRDNINQALKRMNITT
jgi:HK97 family phage prohead protease